MQTPCTKNKKQHEGAWLPGKVLFPPSVLEVNVRALDDRMLLEAAYVFVDGVSGAGNARVHPILRNSYSTFQIKVLAEVCNPACNCLLVLIKVDIFVIKQHLVI